MVKIHISEHKYSSLSRFDDLLINRQNKLNRYYVFFLFFYSDFFVYKIINKLMFHGKKSVALSLFRKSLSYLKSFLGFQPFFFFKHISFKMRQLFKIQKTLIRQSKSIYLPLLLKPHNQIIYGMNHLISCAKQLSLEEHLDISYSLSIVWLNSFISLSDSENGSNA